jgi:predicted nucleic acid-binding protein
VYTLDTNAIIYYLDEDPAVVSVLDPLLAQDIALFVSAVTELELLSYPRRSSVAERYSSFTQEVSV